MGRFTLDNSIATDIKSAASDSFKDNIKMIEIENIKPCIDNFYAMSDIELLADDIERQGLKHNLVVNEDKDNQGSYFIKSGHRRFSAIRFLMAENRYKSKYVPCLVDGVKTKSENMLDLIMLNATTRVMSDAELYKQYEVLKETLEQLEQDGKKIKGRLRENIATLLSVSPAQVGKIENIRHNAVDEVKEAVANGDMTIATGDSVAKLSEDKQKELLDEKSVTEITTNDAKSKKSETSQKSFEPVTPVSHTEDDNGFDYSEDFDDESDDEEVDHDAIAEEFNTAGNHFDYGDENDAVAEFEEDAETDISENSNTEENNISNAIDAYRDFLTLITEQFGERISRATSIEELNNARELMRTELRRADMTYNI